MVSLGVYEMYLRLEYTRVAQWLVTCAIFGSKNPVRVMGPISDADHFVC